MPEAPLGLATIRYELPAGIVIVHFLLALLALGGAIVVALEAVREEWGGAAISFPRELRWAAAALAAACLVLVVTGTFSTAAGPHSGDADVVERLWHLDDAVYLHVRTTAVFGALFLFVLGLLAARGALRPRCSTSPSSFWAFCCSKWASVSCSGASSFRGGSLPSTWRWRRRFGARPSPSER